MPEKNQNCSVPAILSPSSLSSTLDQVVYKADVVLSDMMVNMCGNTETDHFRSIDLCFNALEFTDKYLKTNGNFIYKYFRGNDEKELLDELKSKFHQVKLIKPDASRKESNEMYVVAMTKK